VNIAISVINDSQVDHLGIYNIFYNMIIGCEMIQAISNQLLIAEAGV
jgi:hypothetical protein